MHVFNLKIAHLHIELSTHRVNLISKRFQTVLIFIGGGGYNIILLFTKLQPYLIFWKPPYVKWYHKRQSIKTYIENYWRRSRTTFRYINLCNLLKIKISKFEGFPIFARYSAQLDFLKNPHKCRSFLPMINKQMYSVTQIVNKKASEYYNWNENTKLESEDFCYAKHRYTARFSILTTHNLIICTV